MLAHLVDSKFRINRKSKLMAYKSLTQLKGAYWRGVDIDALRKVDSIEGLLRVFNWDPVVDGSGNIVGLRFFGSAFINEEVLFRTIAPFVETGCYVNLCSNDGQVMYSFEGGRCTVKFGQV